MAPTSQTRTPSPDPEGRRAALAFGGLVFAVAAPATYFAERLIEHVSGEAGDPRLVLATLHTVYYWRLAVAVWWGGVVALLALALVVPAPRAVRGVALLGLVLFPVLLALAVRFP